MSNNNARTTAPTPRTSSGSSQGEQAAAAQGQVDVMGMIEQLQAHIATLEGRLATRTVKVKPPEAFDGTRSKLRAFLTQMDMYMKMNGERLSAESDKIVFAATYLTGAAFDWFEPFIRDFQENAERNQGDETKEMFEDYGNFKERLRTTFGDIDAVRNAERKLWRLRQVKSVSQYASEFQQVISQLDWDDDAYLARFEEGLKPEVQEKLIWMERPDSLNKMIEQAVKIDNKLFDFNVRRKNHSGNRYQGNSKTDKYKANDRRQAQPKSQGYSDPYGLQPMELDAAQHREIPKEERDRRRKDRACYNCGKQGHMAKECRSGKNNREPRKQLKATREEARGTYDTTEAEKVPMTGVNRKTLCATYEIDWSNEPTDDLSDHWWSDDYDIEDQSYPTEESGTVESNRGCDKIHARTDGSEKAIDTNEPVGEDEFPSIVWDDIDPLDEQYGTQANGREGNTEALDERTATPQNPLEVKEDLDNINRIQNERDTQKALKALRERSIVTNRIKELNGAIEKKIHSEVTECTHWDLRCWDKTKESWDEHHWGCTKHPGTWCTQCQKDNTWYHDELAKLEHKRHSNPHGQCDYEWCLCAHFRTHPRHKELPWIVCYDMHCKQHNAEKAASGYTPKIPKSVDGWGTTCPCWDLQCSCRSYPQHPGHDSVIWMQCYDNKCERHYDDKFINAYLPAPPPYERAPNWRKRENQLAATKWGTHIKFIAKVNGQAARVMLDSGSTGNFMDPQFQQKLGIEGISKANPEPISGLNGEDLGKQLTIESGPLPMVVSSHFERINFDVTQLGRYDIVLGIPWLRDHNPEVN